MNPDDERLRGHESARGSEAKRLYDDPLLKDAVEAIKINIMTALVNAKDDDERLMAQARLVGLNDILQSLKTYIETGHMADMQLAEKRKQNGSDKRAG